MKEKERNRERKRKKKGRVKPQGMKEERGYMTQGVIDRDKKYDRKEKTRYGCWWSH